MSQCMVCAMCSLLAARYSGVGEQRYWRCLLLPPAEERESVATEVIYVY